VLTTSQVNQFQHDGYVMVPGFFQQEEVRAMQLQVDFWLGEGRIRNVSTAGDGTTPSTTSQNLQLVPLAPFGRLFRSLPFHPDVVEAVSQLLDDPVTKILDQLFYKPARIGGPTNWHTDNAYFRLANPLKGVAMWIAIHDANQDNGALKVIPCQFNIAHPHQRDPDSNHHIRMQADEDAAVHCELAAGGVVFFCFGTPHATGPNNTDMPRCGAGIHFLNADHLPDHLGSGDGSRANVCITGDRADNGMTEYGEDLAGVWQQEVNSFVAGG
jgi:hypothetical protein